MPELLYDTETHNRLSVFVLSFILHLVGTVYSKNILHHLIPRMVTTHQYIPTMLHFHPYHQ